jgi:hypothetical protein
MDLEVITTYNCSQAMSYGFDNDGLLTNPCTGQDEARVNYSKAEAQISDLPQLGQNFLAGGAKALVLYFYGNPINAVTEPMSVVLTDVTDANAAVTYGTEPDEDMSDVNEATWHEWNIALTRFSGIDLTQIKAIAIYFGPGAGGGGTVFFDDISLCGQRCVLSKRTAEFARADFVDNDCLVNKREVAEMSADWLLENVAEVGWAGPWDNNDIGNTATAGSFTPSGDTYTIQGSGADIWGTADAFHYVFKPLSGDGRLTANVINIGGTSTNVWQKAGVMIRETLDAGSRNVMMLMSAGGASANFGGGDAFQWRPSAGSGSSSSHLVGDNIEILPPTCVRLVRKGNTFRGYVYVNGRWVQEGSAVTVPMTDPVYIGLAVTSHDNAAGVYTTATFDQDCDLSFASLAELLADGIIDFFDYALLMQHYLKEQLYP